MAKDPEGQNSVNRRPTLVYWVSEDPAAVWPTHLEDYTFFSHALSGQVANAVFCRKKGGQAKDPEVSVTCVRFTIGSCCGV